MKRIVALFLILSLVLSGESQILLVQSIDAYANSNQSLESDFYELKEAKNDFELSQNELFGWSGGSKTNGDNKIISAEFEYANLTYSDIENKATFYYTDDYFKNDSTTYNNHLSTMSIGLALAGVGNVMEDKKDKYGNAKDILSKIGFDNITPNNYFLNDPEEGSMGTLIANKHIYLKDEEGHVNEFNLMAIVQRSANYKYEWVSNFKIGESGDHQGFSESRDIVYNDFSTFYNEHKDDYGANLPVKVWMVGYSRGAAVTNLLGGKVTDNAASFNTRKEDIYCYTLGTPKAVLASAHTESLDSYTNIHNVVSAADLFALAVPETFGFGRFGVDHLVPSFKSDKVHDATAKAEIQQNNEEYMVKYNKMIQYLRKLEPEAEVDLNDFKTYELTLFDFATFQYMIFKRLDEEEFTATSDEKKYYQAYEFFPTFVNDFLASDVLACAYPGIDYATITRRDRYYQKYQELLCWAAKTFLSGDGRSSQIISKITQNAQSNMLSLLGLVVCLKELVYCEGTPQARNHFIMYYDPEEEYEESQYQDVYELLRQHVYPSLFTGAFSDEDYNFLMSHHRDITDFLLDLLNADYRTTNLATKSALGSVYQNAGILKALHINAYYLAWLQSEDDYYDTEPENVIKYEGTKTLTFTDLKDSHIDVYDENNTKVCEYAVDTSNNVTYTEIVENNYIDIVKSYRPEGLELRLPSDKKYRAVVKVNNNKSLGEVVYREYFVADAEFYRKEESLGNITLNTNEAFKITFNKSSVQNVYSCYKKSELSGHKAAAFLTADINGTEIGYGLDSFSYASEPMFIKSTFENLVVATNSDINFGSIATVSEIIIDNVATESELTDVEEEDNVDNIATESELIDVENEETVDAVATESELIDDAEVDEEGTLSEGNEEQEELEIIATESEIVEDVEVSGFTTSETSKYSVNFTTNAEGTFYYFDGEKYVEGKSGDRYDVGTKIKFTAPASYDGRQFYGWTLTDSNNKHLNAKGIDTPKIMDDSDVDNSSYILELKNYNINIVANYQYKEYTLKLSVDANKGNIEPEDAEISYTTTEAFNAVKGNISVAGNKKNTFLHWSDGLANYKKLSDYNWTYKKDVTLTAVFETYNPKPLPPSGGGGNNGGGGGGGGSAIGTVQGNTSYITNMISGLNVHNDTPSGNWEQNSFNVLANGGFRYKVGDNNYLSNGLYRINNNYYMFDMGGYMLTGLQTLNNNIYYFEESGNNMGSMVQGERNINGVLYTFGMDGALTIPQDGALKAANGEWQYYPLTNSWEYYAYGVDGTKNKLINGVYSIKNADNTYTNYFFNANGLLINM